VLDIRLPGKSGLDFQRELATANTHLPIIFITGHGGIPMTVQAMKGGAIEFLTKPFREQDLLDAIQLGLERDMSVVRQLGAFADRLVTHASPAVQSCKRLRLPADYLYLHDSAI
jgi:FixJ family two-component response regulator